MRFPFNKLDPVDVFFLIYAAFVIALFQWNPVVSVFLIISGFIGYIVSKFFYFKYYDPSTPSSTRNYFEIDNEELGYENIMFDIVAYVIRADGKVTKEEILFVKRYLDRSYDSKDVNHYMLLLKKALDEKRNPERACNYLAENYGVSTTVQILHFLVGIVTCDGFLSRKEFLALQEVSVYFKIPYRTLDSILAMFQFVREREQRKSRPKRKSLQLDSAYAILEITSSATDQEIKSAYRKLAKIHHPDKVIHLGENMQEQAKIKFQKIQEAYELIKEKRGFS